MSSTSGELGVDAILNFFRPGPTVKVVHENVTATGGQGILSKRREEMMRKQKILPSYKRQSFENYTQKYIDKEEKSLVCSLQGTTLATQEDAESSQSLMRLEEISSHTDLPDVNSLYQEETAQLFDKYHTKYKYDPNLAITNYRDKIVNMIEAYQVVVIQGSTGCGKTTQVPQYILDKYAEDQRHCNIIVTQPRRIAAISIANRVCHERRWNVGDLVGYQVGMDKQASEQTRLTYVTTGVLLQKLVSNKRMDNFTHVIIDEVHERDQYTDFALLIVRKFLRSVSRGVKVILMSATFDTDQFARYFSMPVLNKLEPAPVIKIEGKTYAVSEFYLQDFLPLGNLPVLDLANPNIPVESYKLAVKLIQNFDRIEKLEMELEDDDQTTIVNRGTVLMFLPGIFEIQEMEEHLCHENANFNNLKWQILPLHSTVTIDEQRRVFEPPSQGWRKLILATNIAESSITVPDIKYVIDFCLTKHLVCDPQTHYTCLELNWASKANCMQRRGRAGRVSSGRVYRMISKEMYDGLSEFGVPEMTRCPLENTLLKVKQLDLGEPKAILALALTPPSINDIERTVILLKEVGALAMTSNGFFSPHDGDLTFAGKIMASLPMDVKLAKLIVYGYALGCVEKCVIIAACLASKTFFAKPFGEGLKAYISKTSWSHGHFSDPLAALSVYERWQAKKLNGEFNRPCGESESSWCKRNYLQKRRLRDVEIQVHDLKMRLEQSGIRFARHSHEGNSAEDLVILKLAICGAFYPNYFLSDFHDETYINRDLWGLSPLTTVSVSGIPNNHGLCYSHAIKALLEKHCNSSVKMIFESSRAYVTFEPRNGQSTNKILPAVYYAIKMRQARIPMEIQLMEPGEAAAAMRVIRSCQNNDQLQSSAMAEATDEIRELWKECKLPDLDVTSIELTVTHVNNCSSFWAQQYEPGTLELIMELSNNRNHNRVAGPLTPGMLVLAPYQQRYYRARVDVVFRSGNIQVFYIDFGNMATVEKSQLLLVDRSTAELLITKPALAFECALAEVRPSAIKSSDGDWSKEANDMLCDFVNVKGNYKIHGKIYSIVHKLIRLELYKIHAMRQVNQVCFTDQLLERKLAEKTKESYLSKQNHSYRENSFYERVMPTTNEPNYVNIASIPEYRGRDKYNAKKFRLKGPSSPLEMTFSALTKAGCQKAVRIDMDSVNSVALEAEPWEQNLKMLVASHVELSASHGAIKARSTTLMPSIRGLSSIIPLIFAPKAELRADRKMRSITGALCGLGMDDISETSFYPDHDMEIIFDVGITTDDILRINAVRMALNMVLSGHSELRSHLVPEIQKRCREKLMGIITKEREEINRQPYPYAYQWNMIHEDRIIKSQLNSELADCPYVLPLHNFICLDDGSEERDEMVEHLQYLKEVADKKSNVYEVIECRLCRIKVSSSQELMLHLISSSHKSKESLYTYKNCEV